MVTPFWMGATKGGVEHVPIRGLSMPRISVRGTVVSSPSASWRGMPGKGSGLLFHVKHRPGSPGGKSGGSRSVPKCRATARVDAIQPAHLSAALGRPAGRVHGRWGAVSGDGNAIWPSWCRRGGPHPTPVRRGTRTAVDTFRAVLKAPKAQTASPLQVDGGGLGSAWLGMFAPRSCIRVRVASSKATRSAVLLPNRTGVADSDTRAAELARA